MDDRSKPDDKRQDMSIRSVAMEMAIKSGVGTDYNDEGMQIVKADKIVEAAKKFETFIKGETFVNGVSNNPNNPETKFK